MQLWNSSCRKTKGILWNNDSKIYNWVPNWKVNRCWWECSLQLGTIRFTVRKVHFVSVSGGRRGGFNHKISQTHLYDPQQATYNNDNNYSNNRACILFSKDTGRHQSFERVVQGPVHQYPRVWKDWIWMNPIKGNQGRKLFPSLTKLCSSTICHQSRKKWNFVWASWVSDKKYVWAKSNIPSIFMNIPIFGGGIASSKSMIYVMCVYIYI